MELEDRPVTQKGTQEDWNALRIWHLWNLQSDMFLTYPIPGT